MIIGFLDLIFMYKSGLKRVLDIIFAFCGMIIAIPLMSLIIFLAFWNTNGKPLFFQKRPGLHGNIFTLIKIRTMSDKKDQNGILLSDQERLTAFGRFLRKTSLDELPQLWNVLIGNMSIIGPRPLLVEYLPLYSDRQNKRHEVRPGITGWAQINGRNSITWEQKFDLDVWYVENLSFLLDLKIILLTVKKVFNREDIDSSAEVTMPKFNGNN